MRLKFATSALANVPCGTCGKDTLHVKNVCRECGNVIEVGLTLNADWGNRKAKRGERAKALRKLIQERPMLPKAAYAKITGCSLALVKRVCHELGKRCEKGSA